MVTIGSGASELPASAVVGAEMPLVAKPRPRSVQCGGLAPCSGSIIGCWQASDLDFVIGVPRPSDTCFMRARAKYASNGKRW